VVVLGRVQQARAVVPLEAAPVVLVEDVVQLGVVGVVAVVAAVVVAAAAVAAAAVKVLADVPGYPSFLVFVFTLLSVN